jgi:hypothetical protein
MAYCYFGRLTHPRGGRRCRAWTRRSVSHLLRLRLSSAALSWLARRRAKSQKQVLPESQSDLCRADRPDDQAEAGNAFDRSWTRVYERGPAQLQPVRGLPHRTH